MPISHTSTGVRSTRRSRRRSLNRLRAATRPVSPRPCYELVGGKNSLIFVPITRERYSL